MAQKVRWLDGWLLGGGFKNAPTSPRSMAGSIARSGVVSVDELLG